MVLNKPDMARNFSAAVESYGNWSEAQERIARRLIALLPEEILPGKILDLGCGTGLLTGMLLEQYQAAEIHGIDLAPGMIDACKRKWENCPDLRFTVADAESDPLGSDYSLIASTCAFQWFLARGETLKRLSKLLAPGGWLAVGVPVAGSFFELIDSYRRTLGARLPGLKLATAQEYLDNLGKTGLGLRLFQEEEIVLFYRDGWEMLRAFKELGATFYNYPGYSPRTTGEIRRLIREYEGRYRVSSRGVPVTYRALYFLTEKAE